MNEAFCSPECMSLLRTTAGAITGAVLAVLLWAMIYGIHYWLVSRTAKVAHRNEADAWARRMYSMAVRQRAEEHERERDIQAYWVHPKKALKQATKEMEGTDTE